ncbi:MAG TPA: protein kinase [Acidimicrobiales bacterium]|nr:protein kinase [Acidimicrobiales bacterium]
MRDSIADYQLMRAWGAAGRRHVARAPDRLGRADEVLVSELAVDAEGWQTLCDRLVRLAQVPGGGLLEVLEVGPDLETGAVFLVSELPEEPPVLPRAGEQRDRLLGALAAAATTLHGMHETGIAHGSVTADALLFTSRGPVLDLPLLDAQPGEIVNLDHWRRLEAMDPELLGGEAPSRGSDIWSLGATLHALLSDRPLFPGMEHDETVTAVQRMLFTRPSPDARIPGDLLVLVQDCLEPDPADRPQTALVVAERMAAAGVSA